MVGRRVVSVASSTGGMYAQTSNPASHSLVDDATDAPRHTSGHYCPLEYTWAQLPQFTSYQWKDPKAVTGPIEGAIASGNWADREGEDRVWLPLPTTDGAGGPLPDSPKTARARVGRWLARNSLVAEQGWLHIRLLTKTRRRAPFHTHRALRILTFPYAKASHLKRWALKLRGGSQYVGRSVRAVKLQGVRAPSR